MKKFYRGMEVRKRLDMLDQQKREGNQAAQEVTIKETFFDSEINGAAWVGFFLVTFQQLTGINAILFYSAQLFGSNSSTGLTDA